MDLAGLLVGGKSSGSAPQRSDHRSVRAVQPRNAQLLLTGAPVNVPFEPSDSGLHERLYQTATTHFRSRRVGSEVLHENKK